jgi:hypothetical protein
MDACAHLAFDPLITLKRLYGIITEKHVVCNRIAVFSPRPLGSLTDGSGEPSYGTIFHGGVRCPDILAFSQPRHFAARLAYPYTRKLQKRFARDLAAAMMRAVSF